MKPLYLDDGSTRVVHRDVLNAMLPYFTTSYGNPSSSHVLGEQARVALNRARTTLAARLGAKAHELIFTSGTSESNSWALQGLARAYPKKKTIITSAIEHASIRETCAFLARQGYRIITIPVTREGLIREDVLEHELKHADVLVVSIMHVNNVIGTIQNISAIGALCARHHVLFHTDASQSFGKLPLDVKKSQVDLASLSSHKVGGPKGIGALYIRDGVLVTPIIFGGGQERGMRGGTENVPAIVGFAKALEVARTINTEKIQKLREYLMERLEELGGVVNGSTEKRIYNNVHVSFAGVDATTLVAFLSHHGVYVSSGSACDSTREKEDHVLKALGLSGEEMGGSLRITLNERTTRADVNRLIVLLKKILATLRRV